MILLLVTRPFNSAAGLSKPFRPPGFVEISAVAIPNPSLKKPPPHLELDCRPVTPGTLAEEVHSHHSEEGRKPTNS